MLIWALGTCCLASAIDHMAAATFRAEERYRGWAFSDKNNL